MKLVITQSDLVTAYGWGIDSLWQGMLSGQSAITASDRFSARNYITRQMALIPGLDVPTDSSRVMAMLRRLLQPLVGALDPLTPVVLATTVGEIEYAELSVQEHNPTLAVTARPDVLLSRIKYYLRLRGEGMVISSACASSAAALSQAAAIIQHKEASSVLLVCCDAISEFVFSGFSSLLGLSENPARPFDAQRNGLTLGEAAAFALLTDADVTQPTSWSSQILGWGNTSDAIHMTAPDRTGSGLIHAIHKACTMAGRSPAEVGFIAAHGTATQFSDAMEIVAFKEVFPEPLPVFSTKGGTGHTLGAAGMVQILTVQEVLKQGMVPPTVGMKVGDPHAAGWVTDKSVPLAAQKLGLSTNSGFAGVNSAILLAGGKQP